MANQNSCRSICGYYDANAKFRTTQKAMFRKFCPTCDLELVSKYSRCPCCHDSFQRSVV